MIKMAEMRNAVESKRMLNVREKGFRGGGLAMREAERAIIVRRSFVEERPE
jgi:hypothetical protein